MTAKFFVEKLRRMLLNFGLSEIQIGQILCLIANFLKRGEADETD